MGRPSDYIHDSKAEIIYHLRHGPILVSRALACNLFGSNFWEVGSELRKQKDFNWGYLSTTSLENPPRVRMELLPL
jgi:hypothetical protein